MMDGPYRSPPRCAACLTSLSPRLPSFCNGCRTPGGGFKRRAMGAAHRLPMSRRAENSRAWDFGADAGRTLMLLQPVNWWLSCSCAHSMSRVGSGGPLCPRPELAENGDMTQSESALTPSATSRSAGTAAAGQPPSDPFRPAPPDPRRLGGTVRRDFSDLHRAASHRGDFRPLGHSGILVQRPEGFRRTAMLESVAAEMRLKGVFAAEGEDWRRQRRIVTAA